MWTGSSFHIYLPELSEQLEIINIISSIDKKIETKLTVFSDLRKKGYKVFGLTRRTSTPNYERIKHIEDKINLFIEILDIILQIKK